MAAEPEQPNSRRFDPGQLAAIRVEGNAVVMAGAGSGKTSVLAERFCWLLEERGVEVEQILALTFTQKAAAEMYERIYGRLSQAQGLVREKLQRFDRARICTLDSFCAEVVRAASELFGLPPDFRQDEEAVARLAEGMSLDFLLENLGHPALEALLRIHDFETVWQELFAALALDRFHLGGGEGLPETAEKQLQRCRQDLEAAASRLQALLHGLAELAPRLGSARTARQQLAPLEGLSELLGAERFAEAGGLLSGLKLRRPGRGGEEVQRLKELVEELNSLLEDLRLLSLTLAGESMLRGVFALLEQFRARFLQRKRTLGLVTFQDVAQLSVLALLSNRPLREHYKRRYRYILIDEFQDNNRLQKDLLYLLSERRDRFASRIPEAGELEPDRLFFVGDEKQSIYRFRGADVSVFKSLQAELEGNGGRSILLDRNYRSEGGLIAFFNRIFAGILGEGACPYEARFQPMLRGGADAPFAPQVHLFYGHPEQEQEGEASLPRSAAEAWTVARFIHEAVRERRLPVREGTGERAAGYDDFAVLLRSTGHQIHYERMFRRFAIPFSTDNVRSLFLEAPAGDLYLLLQLAVYPEDRAAYAGLLRSPLVRVSDRAMLRLLLASPSGPFEEDLERAGIEGEERSKLEQGRELYEFVRARADRLPIADLIHQLWYAWGYRYWILRRPGSHNYLEHVEYLLKLAERADRQGDSLAVFLDFLRRNLGRYERIPDLEVLRPRRPGVQLLTIHRAKGLEFPVVILADTGNVGRADGQGLPYYRSEQFGVTLNLGRDNYFTRLSEREAAERELAEIKRLLYVACTRARHHLVVSGCHHRANRTAPGAHLNLLLQGLGVTPETLVAAVPPAGAPYRLELHRIENPGRQGWLASAEVRSSPSPASMAALYGREPRQRSYRRREISVSELCALAASPGSGATPRPRLLPALPVDPLLEREGLEGPFGSLAHRLLSAWLQHPSASPPEPDWRGLRVPPPHRQPLLEAALSLCRLFLASPLGGLAGRAESLRSELPFLYLWQGEAGPLYISGQVDLVFRAEERTYLVDFKTDRSYRRGQHAHQLGLYTLALREILPSPLEAIVVLLRSGEAVRERLPDWPGLLRSLPW
jgi:ATP-dependent exoDNAse (exonuclease V) beta subunit